MAVEGYEMGGIKMHEAKEQIMAKFQQISFELSDLGIYYCGKNIDQVKSQPPYQKVDACVKTDDEFDMV